eukprot:TRINITY_DN23147_c1_g1_i1.p1 TRINITY_DN23147_c1_g1~~TRINITY_DN23147_c1_g1_i1.p1  ORF type:complete len:164 (-),score=26.17 TRINITY_DN23147_c1_g1_i1:96-587(-)
MDPKAPLAPSAVMRAMWEARESSDVRLIAEGGESINAHGCVLEVASPVFAAALQSGMRESSTREIRLPEAKANLITGVLQLLYLGSLPPDTCKLSVLHFSHKYEIVLAVSHIANDIIANMTAEDAAETVKIMRSFGHEGRRLLQAIIGAWKDDAIMVSILERL